MTREEAIDKMEFCKRAYQMMIDENSQEGVFVGKGFEGKWKADTPLYKVYEDMRDACAMAIQALEQEPCEDCISRQATLNALCDNSIPIVYKGKPSFVVAYAKVLESIPSVNPQEPKTGHWITCDVLQEVKCSECRMCFRHTTNYCPNCGAKMEDKS